MQSPLGGIWLEGEGGLVGDILSPLFDRCFIQKKEKAKGLLTLANLMGE